jgi:GT2 family glycosyltransferase
VAMFFGEYEMLANSGLFDAKYYVKNNPDIAALNVDPLMHYIEYGCRERRNPSDRFDTAHYLSQCLALGGAPVNPLFHYVTEGIKKGLTPRANGRSAAKPRRAGLKGREVSDSTGSNIDGARQSVAAEPASVSSRAYGATGMPIVEKNTPATVLEPSVAGGSFTGYIDSFGYSSAAGGWIYNGWIPRPLRTDLTEPVDLIATHESRENRGKAILTFYEREDLDHKAIGVIACVLTSTLVSGALQTVTFELDRVRYTALTGSSTERLLDQALMERVRSNLISRGFANRYRAQLLSLTTRRGYAGHDTLADLSEPVHLEIDDAIACPPDCALLKGWLLAAPGVVRRLRVRSGSLAGELNLTKAIPVARADVVSTVGQGLGLTELHCGFVAYVSGAISPGEPVYIEVELESDEVGFKNVRVSKRSGIEAIRRILEGLDIRFEQTAPHFDQVLGPAIQSINTVRLKEPVGVTSFDLGRLPEKPHGSLIIPLYGRVDFVEYQMAFFSRDRDLARHEIIYVLDDPSKRRDFEVLAQSVFERFRVPFRMLLLSRNLGFAPANNQGLKLARGQYVCFLNSDAFPIMDGWLSRLTRQLADNPGIGLLGAQLRFEDGSIQHEGCFYRPIREFGGWAFVEHFNKGRRPTQTAGLRYCDAITGACMVLERSLALELGGFDESYIIGDFEDSDLCLRVRKLGKRCAVDQGVHLYHLERKSQAAPSQNWRMNLTLFNAWLHERRWSGTLGELMAAPRAEGG